jgi:RHS repeat-associated protein
VVTADAHNWIHATSSPDYRYDAAGNMTYDATAALNYTFDQENRITGTGGYTYAYDGNGNRVRKSNGNLAVNGTLYWATMPGVVAETDLTGTTKSEYIFFNGQRIARRDGVNGTGGVFYYFSDHLKTTAVITDSAGAPKGESDSYPWGGELQLVSNDSNHYKFTGKERDVESGLDYFGARYYSSGLGRFVTSDWASKAATVPYADLTDPQSLNLYSYVRNLPTTKMDGDGHTSACDGKTNCTTSTVKSTRVEETENEVHVITSTVTTTQYTAPDGASVGIVSGQMTDSMYSREAGHEGEYLGSAERTLDTFQGVSYDPAKGSPGTLAGGGYAASTVLHKGTDWHTTNMSASQALKLAGPDAMSKMVEHSTPSIALGTLKSAANDPHAIVHAGAAITGGVCLATPCAEAVAVGAFVVESANYLWEKLEK